MSSEEPSYIYVFKPKLMGPAHEFVLSKDTLDWSLGARSGRISYPMIKHIRLGYKPTNLANSRFIAEIWSINSPKLSVQSVSSRSMFDVIDQGNDYVRFVRELHRRVESSRADCVYDSGFPAWRWWPAVLVAVTTVALVAYIIIQALTGAHYVVAGGITLIGAWFLWQIWNIVLRNRPRRYDPQNLPVDILPATSE